ncbi:hypothetical protein GCM10010319_47850 [Streptomyces blastmyceticus]|uniref:Uncharacterized protein n=1 Tax=Streptomyces blastmyceticus TaxID=68180 RepID=A0ABP3H7Y1_9ACTN
MAITAMPSPIRASPPVARASVAIPAPVLARQYAPVAAHSTTNSQPTSGGPCTAHLPGRADLPPEDSRSSCITWERTGAEGEHFGAHGTPAHARWHGGAPEPRTGAREEREKKILPRTPCSGESKGTEGA